MLVPEIIQATRPAARGVYLLIAIAIAVFVLWWGDLAWETAGFVVGGMLEVMPIVVPGIMLAAWITASGASNRVAAVFHGRPVQAIMAATLVGALSPVCGVTVLPLMAGLLAAGVPLAPVMAFWLASPITDPAMLSVTVATLGWQFAIGKDAGRSRSWAARRRCYKRLRQSPMGYLALALQQAGRLAWKVMRQLR
jgi:hypothetical protein